MSSYSGSTGWHDEAKARGLLEVFRQSSGAWRESQSGRSISDVTRRAIFDELRVSGPNWSGRLLEVEFLSRVFDLDDLPSTDGRFSTMRGDISQHRENNWDWPDDWVFSDSRLDLLYGPDQKFLRFLCEIVHPVVQPDTGHAKWFVSRCNAHLEADGWELFAGPPISEKPTYKARSKTSTQVVLQQEAGSSDVLSGEYVSELSAKCDARLLAQDYDGAVTVGRTLLEAVLAELELRLTGKDGVHKGNLPKQFKKATKLLNMDDQRPDLDDRFKDVIRGLVMVVNGLAPLRNRLSDGHARVRMPEPHHAQMVVNAAKTVAAFLVESYVYQIEKRLLADAAVPEEETSS